MCLVDGMIKKLLRLNDPLINIDLKMRPVNEDTVEVSKTISSGLRNIYLIVGINNASGFYLAKIRNTINRL